MDWQPLGRFKTFILVLIMRHVVVFKLLNNPLAVFATVPAEESAEILCKDATRLGYKDAKVLSEPEFRKACVDRRKSPSGPNGTG